MPRFQRVALIVHICITGLMLGYPNRSLAEDGADIERLKLRAAQGWDSGSRIRQELLQRMTQAQIAQAKEKSAKTLPQLPAPADKKKGAPRAKYSGPMRFTVFVPCDGSGSFCAPRILAEGTIVAESAETFKAFLRKPADKDSSPGFSLRPKPTVCFDSLGGDLQGAINLGNTIRELGYDTCLELTYEEDIIYNYKLISDQVICASACVFAFSGGVNRKIGEIGGEAKLGVHQFSGAHKQIGDSKTQITVVALAAYLERMGVSRNLLDLASLFPPDKLHWLSKKEMRQFKIDNMFTEPSGWSLDSTEDGSVYAYIAQEKPPNGSKVRLFISKLSGKPTLRVEFVPASPDPRRMQEALEMMMGVGLDVDGKAIASYWDAWRNTGKNSLIASLLLSPEIIQSLRNGKILNVSVSVPNAIRDYDPSLEFPLEGLSRLLPAVIK